MRRRRLRGRMLTIAIIMEAGVTIMAGATVAGPIRAAAPNTAVATVMAAGSRRVDTRSTRTSPAYCRAFSLGSRRPWRRSFAI
ncbi:hypothetical protein MPC1_12520001 [Methylocella tundrae]|nr:hypothetical protein MPC1_12520001 [Methylocella tundrae]